MFNPADVILALSFGLLTPICIGWRQEIWAFFRPLFTGYSGALGQIVVERTSSRSLLWAAPSGVAIAALALVDLWGSGSPSGFDIAVSRAVSSGYVALSGVILYIGSCLLIVFSRPVRGWLYRLPLRNWTRRVIVFALPLILAAVAIALVYVGIAGP